MLYPANQAFDAYFDDVPDNGRRHGPGEIERQFLIETE